MKTHGSTDLRHSGPQVMILVGWTYKYRSYSFGLTSIDLSHLGPHVLILVVRVNKCRSESFGSTSIDLSRSSLQELTLVLLDPQASILVAWTTRSDSVVSRHTEVLVEGPDDPLL